MQILVTGGAGYIASHTIVELIAEGHEPIAYDNLSNSSPVVFDRLEQITGERVEFIRGDVRDRDALAAVFASHDIGCVMHFAGKKAVGESVRKPLEYFDNNVWGSIVLLEAMRDAGCGNIVFSSSATVYGTPTQLPLVETMPKGETANPYGRTKSMIEDILIDTAAATSGMNAVLLRYFNPIGAHESGLIGEDPADIPNNLMPYITQVAVGKLDHLSVFGDDYDTPDGTGVRDYIHVSDLAAGHVAALDALRPEGGVHIYNLGTGKGTSVLELVTAFEEATGVEVPREIACRRPGDVDANWADCSKAESELGWKAVRGIREMCADSWRWQSNNPDGYR